MSAKHLVDLNDHDLVEKLAETKAELFNLRFTHATGQLDKNSRLRDLKREVARINTVIRARELAAAEKGAK